jgi:hypothetical protein
MAEGVSHLVSDVERVAKADHTIPTGQARSDRDSLDFAIDGGETDDGFRGENRGGFSTQRLEKVLVEAITEPPVGETFVRNRIRKRSEEDPIANQSFAGQGVNRPTVNAKFRCE